MKAINGVDYLLGIEKEGTFIPVAGQTDASIKRSAETVDVTTKDSNGWEEVEPGIKSWETSTDGLVIIDDEAYELIEEAYMEGNQLSIQMARKTQSGKARIYKGNCVVTGLDDSFGMKDKVAYSISLKGTGALTITKEAVPQSIEKNKKIEEKKEV